MCPSLVEIRSVTSEIRRRKKRKKNKKETEKTTAVKYKPFAIAMPCGLITDEGGRLLRTYKCSSSDIITCRLGGYVSDASQRVY